MKIVVLDGYVQNPGDISWEALSELGDLAVYDRTPSEEVIDRIGDAEAIFTNKVPFGKETINKLKNVRYIGVMATGYNIVDVEAASKKGITVTNIPGYSTKAVAQLVMALLLELCHHVGEHSLAVRDGAWTNSVDFTFWNFPLTELEGKTMGIVGFGQIGRAVAALAKAFGMRILYNSRNEKEYAVETGAEFSDMDNLLRNSDVISLNCPLTAETRNLINRTNIEKMKKSTMLINTARGPVVNEADLADALNNGLLAGAAVDVLSREPAKKDNPLLTADNCIITPHIAWATKEARQRLMSIAVDNLSEFIKGNPKNTVMP